MTAATPLVDLRVRVSCPWCAYAGCTQCDGRGFVFRAPYAEGGGEQGDERIVCPSCVVGAGQCSRCGGSGWVFA